MKYKNVVCLYPYKQELKSVGFFPPIGLEYIASAIEDMVDNIKIIDLRHEEKPLLSILDGDTDLILISHNWGIEEESVKNIIISLPEKTTVILGGRALIDSSELLGSSKMKTLVDEMKERYEDRYIIFDAPPILTCADTIAFAPFADCIILVVEEGKTSMQDVQKSMEMIPKEKFLGFVINKQKYPSKAKYGYYYK